MANRKVQGVVGGLALAGVAVCIWGVSFVASERLMGTGSFTVSQLMFLRLATAYLTLWIVSPRFYGFAGIVNEIKYIAMALTGIVGYSFCENTAIALGGRGNTSVMLALIPLFTLIMMCVTGQKNKMTLLHLAGFVLAYAGIWLIGTNGMPFTAATDVKFILSSLGACLSWAVFSVLMYSSSEDGTCTHIIRRSVMWGLIVTTVWMLATDGFPATEGLVKLSSWAYIFIIGVLAAALGFVSWFRASELSGLDRISGFMYAEALVAFAINVLMKNAVFTRFSVTGAVLVAAGIILSGISK